jgi:outer membrane protein assembly factor BamE (lipoprotein component of BamABCDE complex)
MLAAMSLSGCVILPVPTPPIGHGLVSEDALKSIKPGTTTRADVLLALGEPTEREDSDRFLAYDWKESHVSIVVAVAAGPYGAVGGAPIWSYRCLALEFDPEGTVARVARLRRNKAETNCLAAWHEKGDPSDEQ